MFTFVNSDKRLGSENQRVTNVGKLWINNWGKAWIYQGLFVTLGRGGRVMRSLLYYTVLNKIWIYEFFFVSLY